MKKTFSLLFCCLCALSANATRFYVNQNATGTGTGTSWTNAYTNLQAAISLAISGDEIWVAAGNYKPTTTTDRNISFTLNSSIKMYGGFVGTETTLAQRDYLTNTTILNGDIGQVGTDTDNTYHIVKCTAATITTRLDGFRIMNGHAHDSEAYGGGMYINGVCAPIIVNCTFVNNYSNATGAAIYISSTSTSFTQIDNCVFSYNLAYGSVLGGSGGILYQSNGNLSIKKSSFLSNTGNIGGALHLRGSKCRIDRCVIAGNMSAGQSIAAGIYATLLDELTMYNTLIIGNESEVNAAMFCDQITSSTIVNCTFAHNKQSRVGTSSSTLAFANSFGNPSLNSFRNNIVWGNSTPQMTTGYGSLVSNSIIQGGYTGGVTISTTNPNFTMPGDIINAPFDTTGLNYHLTTPSSGIDKGSNTYLNTNYNLDLDNNTRAIGLSVDAGCYESTFVSTENTENVTPITMVYANDNIYIAENEALRGQKIHIYGINGALLQTKTIDSDIIPIQNLTNGTYIAKIQNQSLKFVVVK
jgi:hypothetical protein